MESKLSKNKLILFWVITILIPIIILEGAIRGWDYYRGRASERYILSDTKFVGYKSHPFLSYTPRPNSTPRSKIYRINDAGFKSNHEVSYEKRPNVIRIFCMGGSTTFDGEHSDPGTYPGKLERLLSEKYPNIPFEVINAGVPSYTSLENLINLEIRLLDYSPDIIIYYEGANSARANLTNSKNYKSDQSHFRKSFPTDEWFEDQRHWWLSLLEKSRAYVFLRYKLTNYKDKMFIHHYIFTVPIDKITKSDQISEKGLKSFENELRNMIAISREHGIIPILCTFVWDKNYSKDIGGNPLFTSVLNKQNEIIRSIHSSKRVLLADVERLFPNEDGLFIDDVHFSEKGNAHLARIVFESIVKSGLVKNFSVTHDD